MNIPQSLDPYRKSEINAAIIADLNAVHLRDGHLIDIVIHLKSRGWQPLTEELIDKISRRLRRALNELFYGRNFVRNQTFIAYACFHHSVPDHHLHIVAELPVRWMDERFHASSRTLKRVQDCVTAFCKANAFCERNPYIRYNENIEAMINYNHRSNVNGRYVV
jgi:hypothetical protein